MDYLHCECDCENSKYGQTPQTYSDFDKRRVAHTHTVRVAHLAESLIQPPGGCKALGEYAAWLDKRNLLHAIVVTTKEKLVTAQGLNKLLTRLETDPTTILLERKEVGNKTLFRLASFHKLVAVPNAAPTRYICKHMIALAKWIMWATTGSMLAQALWLKGVNQEDYAHLPCVWLNGNVAVLGYGATCEAILSNWLGGMS